MAAPGMRDSLFAAPLIILSAPRSGSTLLFETLAQSPDLVTIGGESHRAIESIPALRLDAHGFASNRLDARDATPDVVAQIHANFASLLRDRDGRPPLHGPVRLLEKTPKNSLRIPFLRAVWPDARFVVLTRSPQATVASIIDAWQSGRFVTYPHLPGWPESRWSLLLVPGWRDLAGRPVPEIAAQQWARTMDVLLDDLADVPRDAVCWLAYEDFIADPAAQIARLCEFAGVGWDRPLDTLPLSRFTVTPPSPEKWRRHEHALANVMPGVAATVARLERVAGVPGAASMP